jgi:predicted secreted protein
MAANTGRAVTFLWGGSAVLGVREKGITVNAEPIDITSDEDNGWRLLLSDAVGERSVEISISGVTKDHRFLADLMGGTYQRAVVITFPNGATLSGTFQLASTGQTAPYKDAQAFDATLQSSGAITFVAGV